MGLFESPAEVAAAAETAVVGDICEAHAGNNFSVSQVPEPTGLALLGLAALGLRRRK